VKCGLSETKLTRKPVVSEKQVTHVGEVAAKAAFAFKQKSPLDAHNRYREQPVFYIPQPSSDDESCRLERIATNSIHSKQRLNTMQIDMHRQKQNTKEREKKTPQEKLDEAHKLFNTNKCFMFILHFKERILRACVKYHPQAREHTKQRQH
jgi:hypothetical protein